MPDSYESTYGLDIQNDDAEDDLDSDGLDNRTEYMLSTSPNESDTDGDGSPDGEEIDSGSDPRDPARFPSPPPSIASISPSSVAAGESLVPVTINGSQFVDGTAVSIAGDGVVVVGVTFVSSGQLDVEITIDRTTELGARDVVVVNPDGQSGKLAGGLTVSPAADSRSIVLTWSNPTGSSLDPPQNLTARLDKTHDPMTDIDEVEPNDSPDEAQFITGVSPLVVSGSIGDGGDIRDYYEFETVEEAPFRLELDQISADLDLGFGVQSEDGAFFVTNFSENEGATASELIEIDDLLPFQYFAIVSQADGAAGATSYRMTVTGGFGEQEVQLQGFRVYRSASVGAFATGFSVAELGPSVTSYTDAGLLEGTYYYQVTATYPEGESPPSNEVSVDVPAITAVEEVEEDIPESPGEFALWPNYPNPFNPTTTISYSIPASEHVTLAVYDAMGRHVQTLVDGVRPAGRHQVRFEARSLSTGIYFYRLVAGIHSSGGRMLLVK